MRQGVLPGALLARISLLGWRKHVRFPQCLQGSPTHASGFLPFSTWIPSSTVGRKRVEPHYFAGSFL